MAIRFIPLPQDNPEHKNTIFSDNALPLEFALAYRKEAQSANQRALVFTANDLSDLNRILQVLSLVKAAQPGQPINLQQIGAVPSSLLQQGYLDQRGNIINPGFQDKVRNNANRPHIEIILDGAVVVLNNDGAAYINSKGGPVEPQLKNALAQSWVNLYDKQGTQEEKQRLAQRHCHAHENIKKQEDNYSGVDWALTNLDILSGDVNANASALQNAQKIDRSQLAGPINRQIDPRQPGGHTPFNVRDCSNEHQNERQWQQRRTQINHAEAQHIRRHEEAQRGIHQFREGPRTPANQWVEVLVAPPPTYSCNEEGSDFNKFNTTRGSNGVNNEFELKQHNIIAKSTGGEATYQQRFERIAEDLYHVFAGEDGVVNTDRIVINSVKPPEKAEECRKAFQKVFPGVEIEIKGLPNEQEDPNAIQAQALTL